MIDAIIALRVPAYYDVMDANTCGFESLLQGHGDGLLADGRVCASEHAVGAAQRFWCGRRAQGEAVEDSDTEQSELDGSGNGDGNSKESNATEHKLLALHNANAMV